MDYKEYLLNLSSGNIAPLTKMQGSNYVNMDTNINALLNLTLNSVIAPRYRVFIVNNDDTIQSEIPLNDIIQGGTFNENYQNGQRCSLSLTVFNQTGEYTPNINKLWVGTKLRLDAGLEQQDGSIIWCQKGIFVITSTQPSYSSDNKTVSISAGDKFAELEGGVGILQDTFEIPAGSRILSVTRELLATQRGDGTPIDAQEPYFHPELAQKVTQAKISKNAGESIGSIILELANHMSAEVFYNAQGRLCFLPINTVSDDNDKPILFNYITDKGHLSDLNFSLDYNNIINRIILIGATVNGGVVRAIASNDDVSSPLCVQRIGARTSVINESGIKTKIIAEENARYNLRKQLILKSSVNLTTPYNPLFGVNNLVMVTDDFYHLIKQYFLIQSVSFNLDYNSSMSLTVSNLNNLPFITNYRSSSEEDMEQYEFNTLTSYGVTITANNGTVIGANRIYANGELTLYVQPNEGYSMPPSITVTGCNYKYYPTSGKIVLRNPIGPVAINVNCSGVYTFAITKGEHITSIVYNISGTTYPSVEEVSLQLVSGTSYSWYAIPVEGYSTEYNESRPCTGILTQDVSYTAVADAITYPVTFSMGDYVLDAFTSKESNATSGNESGHEYGYDSEVFYYVQKYADTDQYKYECSGVQIGSSDIYKLGSVTIDGPINLGVLSSTTRSIQNYPVTFTLGNYVTYAFTSDRSDGDTRYRHESGYEYAYGTTVYYFVEKYAGDNDYVYDCNGTLISGNIYRLDSITIDGHNNNLGVLSNVTRVAIYPVTITAGTDITSVYLSTNPSATSGDISGTKYRDGSTVYGFVTIRANDTEYTYKPQDNWILIDGSTRKYRVNSIYVDSAKTFGTLSAKREINKYSVSITGGIGINSVYLSESDNDTSGDASPHSYEYGTHVYAYVVLKNNTAQYTYSIPPQSGWVLVSGTSRNYKVGDILLTSGNYDFGTKDAIETINQYQVTITAGTDVISVYMSTDPEAESGDTSPHSYDYNTTVYGFAVVPQNDETYTYIIPSDWELVDSGNNRIYRVGSVEATTARDFGTKSITKEYVPYTVTITAGQGVASVYMSTDPDARIGDSSPHTYNYNKTVYGFAILKTDTEAIGYRPQARWQLVEGTTKTYRLTNPVVTTTDRTFGTVDAIVVTTYPVSITAGAGIHEVYLSTNRLATSGDPSGTKYDYDSIVYGFVRILDDTAHYSYLPQDGWTQLQGAGNSKLYRVGEVRVTSAQDFGTLDAIVNVNQYAVTITAGEGIASVYLSTNSVAESGDPSGTAYNYNTRVYGFATLADDTAQYRYDPQSDWILVSGRTYRMKDYVVTTSAQTFGTIDASVGLRSYPVTFTLGDYVTTGFVSTNPEATSGSGSGEVAYGYGTTVYYFVEKYIDTVEYTYTCSGTRIGNTNIYRLGSITIDGTNGNLGEISDVTRTPNNFTLTVNAPEVGIAETWYRIGSTGSYTKITFSGSAVEIPVPYDSYVYIYDVPITGYTANYTQSSPLQFKMGTSGYTYSPVPKTSTLTLTKNTGIASIYYKINGATTWTETTSTTNVNVNYNTNVYWYATAANGYSRDDSYVDPTHYATVPNVKRNYEISPTATRLTYSFTVTLSDFVTQFSYSLNGTTWIPSASSKTFNNVDFNARYYIKPTAYGVSDAQYTYQWVQGSDATTLVTYSSHSDITYQQSQSVNYYPITITSGSGIQSVYLSTDPMATSGDPSGTTYPYNTEDEVYAFVNILNDTVQYKYEPLDGWVKVTPPPYRTYRIGSTTVTSSYNFGTIDAKVTEKTYEVTITKGNGIAGVYLSTSSTATSGDPSGTGYPYNTTVYGFAVIAPATPQYTYSAPYDWTHISEKTYRLKDPVVTKSSQDFGTVNAVSATRSYPVTFTMGPYITKAFVSTSDNATSGSGSGEVAYEYGTTVYYYVEKYIDTVEYTYTCSGTRIGTSNVYRLGSITIDGTNGDLGELSSVTQTPNNFTLTVNAPEVGIAETWYRIGSTGSYTKITFSSETFTVDIPYDSRVYIYDVPVVGYTANYSSESPLTFKMGTSGYTYSPVPKTVPVEITKNTGVASIYYKINGATSWTQTTSSTVLDVNYNTNVYWYAPASTGYSRDDSYIDSSHYATISNVKTRKEVSPTATRLTYSFTVTLSSFVTAFQYTMLDPSVPENWDTKTSSYTFSNVDYNRTVYVRPSTYGQDDAEWTYSWEQGSPDIVTNTYSSHADITYRQSRTKKSYLVTITAGAGVSEVSLSDNKSQPDSTIIGATASKNYDYGTRVYGFTKLASNTVKYTYTAPSTWHQLTSALYNDMYRVEVNGEDSGIRVEGAYNFGPQNAVVTINTYTLTVNAPVVGIAETWYRIGSTGSYTKIEFSSETFTVDVPYDSTVSIYDVPVSGYTANYTSSNPYTFTMGTGTTYSPIPKTVPVEITKNTGVASIYYKINGATSWTQTTSSTVLDVNYNTNVYWYAPAATGYTRDDSYIDSSHYATISNVKTRKEVSPTATGLKYSFTVTLSDYVTEFSYSLNGITWTPSASSKTFNNVDFNTRYYIKPTAYGETDAEWAYSWVQGSAGTTTITYSSHSDITYQQSRTKNSYAVTITGGTGIQSEYLATSNTATTGDVSGTTYKYGTVVYGFVILKDNTAQYTYEPLDGWVKLAGTSRTYRIGYVTTTSAQSFGTVDAEVITNKYAVTITAGNGISSVYLSTHDGAMSGDPSGTTYNYRTRVYGYATISEPTAQYTYSAPVGWTLVSGTTRTYKIGEVVVEEAEDFGTVNAVSATNKYVVTFSLGDYVTNAFTSTTINATSGNASGTKYEYGVRVYYFVTKFTNTTEYTYTCSGTQVSGNIYRLGYIDVDGTNGNLGALSSVTQVPNNFTLTINLPVIGISQTWYKVGSGSYTKVTYGSEAFTTQVPYNSSVSIYDIPISGYTVRYTSTDPLQFTMGTSGYTYSPIPATSTLTIEKNTGVASIWYKKNGESNFIQTTVSRDIAINYNTNVYWYAPGETGYSRDDSYISESTCATISGMKTSRTISPTATRLKYSFTVTLSDYVTQFSYSTDNIHWVTVNASRTFSDIDYDITYYIKPTVYGETDAEWTYTWVQGSTDTTIMTYGGPDNITYKQSRTKNSYAVTITGGTGIDSVYLSSISRTATSGDPSGTTYEYGTAVYGFVKIKANTAQYTYEPQDDWVQLAGAGNSRKYRVGEVSVDSARSFGTKNAKVTTNKYAVSITGGTGIASVYLSTHDGAMSGDTSPHSYDYNTKVYAYVTLADDTSEYSYAPQDDWTLVSGTTKSYKVGEVVVKNTYNFGTKVAKVIDPVTFSLGNYVTSAFTSTNINATSGNPSGTVYTYGTRVYYFVTKYENSTEYTYTCSGTQVSGNVYRLGYIDVDGTNSSLGTLSSVTRTPNNFNLIVNMGSTGVTAVYVKIGTGSYVRYPNPDEALFISVPYDTTFQIYDEVAAGYTARYTESVPFVYTMTTAGYTYNTSPATWSISFVKNTGVSAIYYREINSSNWTSITSSQTVSFTYSASSRVYWYAPAATGYTRDDSYVDSSHYAIVYNPTTVSPTATINKYAVTFTLGSYVTRAFTSTNRTATSGNPSGTTYDYGTTVYYFVEKYEDTEKYTYTCSGTRVSGNVYRLGSVLVTSTKNLGALSGVTRTETRVTYIVHIACINNSVISPYYICSDVNDYNDMISQGGLGHWLIVEDTTGISRPASSTEVIVSQSIINDICSPYGYSYTGGPVTVTVSPSNLDIYIGAYVVEDDR